jgi:protein TonB
VATGTNSGTAQARAGAGSGSQGAASDGHAAGDSQAAPAYQPKPTYPAFARRLGHEGRVVIRVQVLSSGAVATASIERSSGYAVLDEAALATIKRWRFRPAHRAGQPVDATLNVPITFKLQEQG